ncbi:Abi-domain-containing protein [Testicularia cyperi]|uniref:intramembrane prenyl-peptidase Rce1 n=1 Tax=Testicularia cyperi TaxID=1882483 RepID=A0A317XL90_9BASI|nr:Abi-domain-containing protein [Testicularia cyperi]
MSLITSLSSPAAGPPLLSPGFAVGACALFTTSYVGLLYLSPATRVGRADDADGKALERDHPKVIRARITISSISAALSLLTTGLVLWYKGVVPNQGTLLTSLNLARLLGLALPTPSFLTSNTLPLDPSLTKYIGWIGKQVASSLILTSSLFLGPLYVSWLSRELPFQSQFDFRRDVIDKVATLPGMRNFVVGPLTEELVFRSCILSNLFFAGVSQSKLIFASPLFFGIAHVHHAYNVGRTRTALKQGLLTALVQFAYTGVFGWLANFLFLRSGSILAPLTSHIFCNVMGLPNPWQASQSFPTKRSYIFGAHILGIALFAKALAPLTSPALLGGSLYWL